MRTSLLLLALAPILVASQNVTSGNLTKWDWTASSPKMNGVALGNWLLLERWMNYDWFIDSCGNATASDEWSFMESIANNTRAVEVLTDHWNSWVTEQDIANISAYGLNHIRIPIGYWALIPAIADTPYAFQAGQMDQVTRVLALAQQYGLYVVLDLHGMPGSQNGEQASGHAGLNGFYGTDNQQYADDTVDALIAYIEASPYRSVISGVEACNEPVYYSDAQFQTLQQYYERTYAKFSTMSDPVPMIFHPGSPNSNPLDSWQPFIDGKDSSLLVFSIHPYPGRGQTLTGSSATQSSLIAQLCSATASYEGYDVPVAITEWSLINPITGDSAWEQEWYSAQAVEYGRSAGGIFWNYFVNTTTSYDLDETIVFYQYSYVDLVARGSIPLPTATQNSTTFLASLQGVCNVTGTETWSSTVASIVPSSTSTGSARRKRVLW